MIKKMKNKTAKLFCICVISLVTLFIMSFAAGAAIVGDVTGEDKKVTASDARIILRASVGLENLTEAQFKVADIDVNGKITAADARSALRMSVALEETVHYYEKEVIKNANCTEDGLAKWTCTECDEPVKDVVLEKLGHDFPAPEILVQVTCDKDGLEKYTCNRCGFSEEKTVPLGHTPDRTAPTCTEDKYCTRGNHVMEEKLGHTTDWGTCTRCKIFNTEKHKDAAAAVKTNFTAAYEAADKAYASINKTIGAASWLKIYTKEAKPEYDKALAAYEAAYAACGEIPELKEIKAKLGKNIENIKGILAQVKKIIDDPRSDLAEDYFELIAPIDDLNYMNSDCVIDTNDALKKLIIW